LQCMCVPVQDDAEVIAVALPWLHSFYWNILQETSPQLKMEGGFP
jgi:hypothetical protein